MRFFRQNDNFSLHRAVVSDDLETLRLLCQNKELLTQKNCLGFTALELAHLLNKRQCIDIFQNVLQDKVLRTIKLVLKGNNLVSKCTVQQFEDVTGIKYLSHLHFRDYNSLKEISDNCPWVLKSSCLGEENRKLGRDFQREINAGYVADLTISWIDDFIGYGVFANQEIPAGSYIGEYTGIVRRLNRLNPDHNAYCFHYPTRFWSWKYFMIDALHEGNETRFINHSNEPNLQPQCIVDADQGLLHLVFFAAKHIDKGSELTFNYGPDYWKHRQKV
jgi:hypothetical protein